MDPLKQYLQSGILPTDPSEAKKITRQVAQYSMVGDTLYKRGIDSPLLRCLSRSEADLVLTEVHEGIASHHVGAKALARKVLRAGYYWPTLVKDATEHVKKCEACQLHGKVFQRPPTELHSMIAPWPFYQWGMDIIGKFKTAPGQFKFVVVAIDYFTKWIEAEALATISAAKVQKFFLRQIIARFGVPHTLVTDNGTQFTAKIFKELVEHFHIAHHFSSVEHPQTNGQAEAANKTILEGLKKRLIDAEGSWADLLPEVLWSIRTTVQTSTGETPFRLTYGCEALLPIETRIPTLRISERPTEINDELLKEELTLSDEIRARAAEREKKAKERQSREYNKWVVPRSFSVGDLVLRRADIGLKNAKEGKFARNWEGPYRVTSKTGSGAYRLETLDQRQLNNSWNATKLKPYYS